MSCPLCCKDGCSCRILHDVEGEAGIREVQGYTTDERGHPGYKAVTFIPKTEEALMLYAKELCSACALGHRQRTDSQGIYHVIGREGTRLPCPVPLVAARELPDEEVGIEHDD